MNTIDRSMEHLFSQCCLLDAVCTLFAGSLCCERIQLHKTLSTCIFFQSVWFCFAETEWAYTFHQVKAGGNYLGANMDDSEDFSLFSKLRIIAFDVSFKV